MSVPKEKEGAKMNLKGAINFRDLGGHLTMDGRRVRKNKFFRSGALSKLTADDCLILESLKITQIVDYRDSHEAAIDADILWTGAQYECCPANPKSHSSANPQDFFSEKALAELPSDFMESLYRQLPFNNPAYQSLMKKVEAQTEGAILHHCAVGKDRTGVGSAIFLLSVGVNPDDILKEYLLTQTGLAPFRQSVLEKVAPTLSDKALAKFEYMMSASEHFLHAAFEEIKNRYKTFDHYLEAEFSLTAERRERLHQIYLEEA